MSGQVRPADTLKVAAQTISGAYGPDILINSHYSDQTVNEPVRKDLSSVQTDSIILSIDSKMTHINFMSDKIDYGNAEYFTRSINAFTTIYLFLIAI